MKVTDLRELELRGNVLHRKREAKVATVASRVRSLLERTGLSREELHSLLDACLDLRDIGEPVSVYEAAPVAAREVAAHLLREAAGWSEGPGRSMVRWWKTLELEPETRRMEVVQRLRRSPSLLPEAMKNDLCTALEALSEGDGHTPNLLTPVAPEGRGRNPRAAAWAEEDMWRWIYWHHGSGHRVADGIAIIAAATGKSAKAVEDWRRAWRGRDGAAEVNRQLAQYRDDPQCRSRVTKGPDELARQWHHHREPAKRRRSLGSGT